MRTFLAAAVLCWSGIAAADEPVVPAAPVVGAPFAGWHEHLFVGDPAGTVRIIPTARIQVDYLATGSDASDLSTTLGVTSQVALRRLRFELGGSILTRWSFLAGVELGEAIDPDVAPLPAISPSAEAPEADLARRAPPDRTTFVPANVWINFAAFPWLNFQVGQAQTPITLENQTRQDFLPLLERAMPIRSFVVPGEKELGLTVWGDIDDRLISYEVAVVTGDGKNRPAEDLDPDVMARVRVQPFHFTDCVVRRAHFGVSVRHGQRDPERVTYDYPLVRTAQGYGLWDLGYRDSRGRFTHVIPSGAQNLAGLEMRVPFWRFDFRGEAYYVANHTREAADGFQATNTERLGTVSGMSWYAQLGLWAFGEPFLTEAPGYIRPRTVDFDKTPRTDTALELAFRLARVRAEYDGASRGGDYDPKTPRPTSVSDSLGSVWEIGAAVRAWQSSMANVGVAYNVYYVPQAGASLDNLARVPETIAGDPEAELHHELTTRVAVAF